MWYCWLGACYVIFSNRWYWNESVYWLWWSQHENILWRRPYYHPIIRYSCPWCHQCLYEGSRDPRHDWRSMLRHMQAWWNWMIPYPTERKISSIERVLNKYLGRSSSTGYHPPIQNLFSQDRPTFFDCSLTICLDRETATGPWSVSVATGNAV